MLFLLYVCLEGRRGRVGIFRSAWFGLGRLFFVFRCGCYGERRFVLLEEVGFFVFGVVCK